VIENPLQSQAGVLRTSLLPGLLRNAAHNLNHGLPGCHLFEIGTVFLPARPGPPRERTRVGYVFAGRGLPVHWSLPRREADLYDARGAAEQIGAFLALSPLTFSSDTIPFLEGGRALRVAADGRPLGVAGEVARVIRERYGIGRPVFAGELDLGALQEAPAPERRYHPVPRTPSVRRDLALVLGDGVPYAAVETTVRRVAGLPLAEVQVFDRYRGPGVPAGSASLAIQIVFQHPERTLQAEEVQAAVEAIVQALRRDLGARLRGAAG
jgi:phenylalanyl-tRNA synthetase beta chain